MAIPAPKELYKPILEETDLVAEDPLRTKKIIELMSDRFELTPEERKEMVGSGRESIIANRTAWAIQGLKGAGLLSSPKRGFWEITPQGREFLNTHESGISYTELRSLIDKNKQAAGNETPTAVAVSEAVESGYSTTPQELMEQSNKQIEEKLADELLEYMMKLPPNRFEDLVVHLLESMGYGKGETVGKSGDGGIDGIIDQDPLGLEKVYVQAKRWSSSQVGEPEMRNFSGSLDAKGATKGVFITTSTFRNSFKRTADNIVKRTNKSIRLIDGRELANLMIQHDVGVVTEYTYEIKKLDENYFAEES